jgi:hypothetical protein
MTRSMVPGPMRKREASAGAGDVMLPAGERAVPEIQPVALGQRGQGVVEESRGRAGAQLRRHAEDDRARVRSQDFAHVLDPLGVVAVEQLEVGQAGHRAAQEREAQLDPDAPGQDTPARQELGVDDRERLAGALRQRRQRGDAPEPGRPRSTMRMGRSGDTGSASAMTISRLSSCGTASSSIDRSAWRMVDTEPAPVDANGSPRRRASSTGST